MNKPGDYYFCYVADPNYVGEECFLITPIKYFEEEGCLYDGEIECELPEGFDELTDSTFGFDGDPKEGKRLLLEAGFKKNEKFDDFCLKDLDGEE